MRLIDADSLETHEQLESFGNGNYEYVEIVYKDDIDDAPTIELEQKKGKWVRITQGAMPEQYICPFCHRTVKSYNVEELLSIRYPYCHCGADMRD